MAYVKKDLQINAGDRMAKLLLFPYIKGKADSIESMGAFGSIKKCLFWKIVVNDQIPKLMV